MKLNQQILKNIIKEVLEEEKVSRQDLVKQDIEQSRLRGAGKLAGQELELYQKLQTMMKMLQQQGTVKGVAQIDKFMDRALALGGHITAEPGAEEPAGAPAVQENKRRKVKVKRK